MDCSYEQFLWSIQLRKKRLARFLLVSLELPIQDVIELCSAWTWFLQLVLIHVENILQEKTLRSGFRSGPLPTQVEPRNKLYAMQ